MEVLVATAIITVVMLVAIGSVLTIQDANRKAQAVRAIIDNLHGALENMSRKIRTGNTYYCGEVGNINQSWAATDCGVTGFGTALSFIATDDVNAQEGSPTIYEMQCMPHSGTDKYPDPTTGRCRGTQTGTVMYYKQSLGFPDFEPLIDPKVNVKSLRFYVRNATGAGGYPSILMTIAGTIKIERINIDTPFNIETTISQYIK